MSELSDLDVARLGIESQALTIRDLRAINAELRAALGGLILHVQERDHYEECFGEAAEMKIARKAYQAATRGEQT